MRKPGRVEDDTVPDDQCSTTSAYERRAPASLVTPGAPAAEEMRRLLAGEHHDPHSLLGAHPHPQGTVIRVLRPHADEVTVLTGDETEHPLERSPEGLFLSLIHI